MEADDRRGCRSLAPSVPHDPQVRPDPLYGELLDGKWRVEGLLGKGGMASVYLAHDGELDREVAVKVLASALADDKTFVARLLREAKVTAGFEHDRIVPVYGVGCHQGRPYIVMKRLRGAPLSHYLRARLAAAELMPREEVLHLARGVAAGLDYIHARGFVHRDIKASNIHVAPDGQPTILDFGILREVRLPAGDPLTSVGTLLGTPSYMAPEQALGMPVDGRADVYSFSVLLYECITGTPPFTGCNDTAVLVKHATQPPPPAGELVEDLPRGVSDVLARGLAKRPSDRWASAGALCDALEAAWGGRPQLGPQSFASIDAPAAPLRDASRRAAGGAAATEPASGLVNRRTRSILLGSSAVGSLLLAGMLVVLWSRDRPRQAAFTREALPSPAPRPASAAAASEPAPSKPRVSPPSSEGVAPASPHAARAAAVPSSPPGRLRVVTTDAGRSTWAKIKVDGAPVGESPIDLPLHAGPHTLVMARPGLPPVKRRVHVAAGKITAVSVELRP